MTRKRNKRILRYEGIMQVYKHCLDWDLLREYFAIFEKNAKYDELKMKYEKYDQ